MGEEKKGKDGEFQMSVDGEQVSNVNIDQINQIMDKVNEGIEKTIASVNENLNNIFNSMNLNNLKKDTSKIDLSNVITKLTDTNLFSKLSNSNLKEKMPVIKTDNGKLSVLLNEKKLFELDLPESENKE